MEKAVYERLTAACQKYRNHIYNEEDFQATILSIADYLTEYELFDFRMLLNQIEGEIETIRFTTGENKIYEKCIPVIEKLENSVKRMKQDK